MTIYIDKENGVSIEDCEKISRRLDKVLDEADPIPDSYIFEVASAGADRELKRPSDFEKFIAGLYFIRSSDAAFESKSWESLLITVLADNQSIVFSKQDVALVRLHVTF